MPLLRGMRPLKRWRYVGVFCEELMACAAIVHVGPLRQTFWALLTRGDSRLRERTHTLFGRGAVELTRGQPSLSAPCGAAPEPIARHGAARALRAPPIPTPGRLRIQTRGVLLDVGFEEDAGWETTCPHGAAYVWTRKQAGIRAHGSLALDGGAPRAIDARAVIDDTAGYHARVTEWWWAAGVGVDSAGRSLAFNLVEGVNDPATDSERAVWIDGEPREAPAVRFARDLSCITAADGSQLRFAAEAERHRHENLLVVRSDYRAPFGSFSGTLPDGTQLAHGFGVIEHHRARW
jgi:hypothetical protein